MAKWTIYATKTIDLSTVVEADSYEEALKLYDNELMEGDYEAENTDWKLEAIVEAQWRPIAYRATVGGGILLIGQNLTRQGR